MVVPLASARRRRFALGSLLRVAIAWLAPQLVSSKPWAAQYVQLDVNASCSMGPTSGCAGASDDSGAVVAYGSSIDCGSGYRCVGMHSEGAVGLCSEGPTFIRAVASVDSVGPVTTDRSDDCCSGYMCTDSDLEEPVVSCSEGPTCAVSLDDVAPAIACVSTDDGYSDDLCVDTGSGYAEPVSTHRSSL